ncbi:hypothetical protein [Bradyrhizobium liaoningense]|uniref:hypothetical protein n=1 Tax=Bradyrhizobium liaoningense TaxID=43992 RepID=UPI001BA4AD8A|nr:hypothetical protein [Bradyrhizobium liaoningense]MBR0817713.1 hypothetical protein [Bradyrhizobium liaoningense]
MRQTVLSIVAAALIAASASQAFAAQSRHVRKDTAVNEQVRKARNAVEQPSRPGWQYSGWSAPAGR